MSGIDVNPAYPPFDPDGDEAPRQDAQEATPDLDPAEAAPGNRPAEGARRASAGEVLSEDFVGGQNAGDFLGLDLEFDGPGPGDSAEPVDGGLELAEPMAAPLPVHDLDGAEAAGLEPEAGLATEVEEPLGGVDFQPDPEAVYEADEDLDGLAEGEFDGELEDYDAEHEELLLEEPTAAGRGRLLLTTVVVAALAFGGVWFGRDFLAPGGGAPSTSPGTGTVADGGAAPAPSPVDPAAQVEFGDPEVAPVEDFGLEPQVGPEPAPPAVATSDDALASLTDFLHEALVESGDAVPPVTAPDGGGELALVEPTPGTTPGPGTSDPGATALLAPSSGPGAEVFESLDWGDPGSLDIVWREETIPMEALSSPARVMLPRVGRVRVTLESGEVMDGSLFAMGQDRVWIDAHVGRIGLDGALVADIQRLVGPAPADPHRIPVATGDRVKIQLPGGTLFARVLSRTGEHVTVATENGARITLRDPQLERVGSTRVQLVDDGTP